MKMRIIAKTEQEAREKLSGKKIISIKTGKYYERIEKYSFIDLVLSGEGEKSFPKFVDAYINNGDFNKVSGLSFRDNENIISVPEEECNETPPSPYNEEFFDKNIVKVIYVPKKILNLIVGRVNN